MLGNFTPEARGERIKFLESALQSLNSEKDSLYADAKKNGLFNNKRMMEIADEWDPLFHQLTQLVDEKIGTGK